MLQTMRQWSDEQGRDKQEILNRLTSDAVQNHRNIRIGAKGDAAHVHNTGFVPDGGLQSVLAQNNVHVVSHIQLACIGSDADYQPGAQILNAGQDRMFAQL